MPKGENLSINDELFVTKKLKFVIPGQPRGFVSYNRGGRGINKAVLRYWEYMKYIREMAEEAGIKLPLEADEKRPVRIKTRCYFQNRVHSDPENCHKGLKDALFYKAKNADKYTSGFYFKPHYDKKNPRMVVNIEPDPEEDLDDLSISPNSKKKRK